MYERIWCGWRDNEIVPRCDGDCRASCIISYSTFPAVIFFAIIAIETAESIPVMCFFVHTLILLHFFCCQFVRSYFHIVYHMDGERFETEIHVLYIIFYTVFHVFTYILYVCVTLTLFCISFFRRYVLVCRISDVVRDGALKHGILFVASAMNAGPALSTVQAPGGTTPGLLGVGAYA